MSDLAIETIGLRKVYGRKTAVADLTLAVPQGEVFGFLGPNGAGKSTAVKMLLRLVMPTDGTARVLGQPPGHTATLARIGFLPEHFRFHEWLRAGEFLDLHGRLYGMDSDSRRRRVPEVLELVGLSEQVQRPLSSFSKGMLQRVGLAQALLHDPDLIFLDEPTSALDPFGRLLVRNIIRALKAQGKTVFLNSHLLGEVEVTCDRVAFIREGRILQTLVLRDLHAGHLSVELRVDVVTPMLRAALEDLVVAWELAEQPEPAHAAPQNGYRGDSISSAFIDAASTAETLVASAVTTTLNLTVADAELLPVIAERVIASGARIYALTPRQTSLEHLFLEIVGREDSGQ
jgi:ABC-2 type transport system ATP-binding protein